MKPSRAVAIGITVGFLAGLLAAIYLNLAGEPRLEEAIALEEAAAQTGLANDSGLNSEDDPAVSRSVQKGIGLFSALAFTGAAFGTIFGVVHGALRAPTTPWQKARLTGILLFTGFVLVPWFKYPPNPPAVGDPATSGQRQSLYLILILATFTLFICTDMVKRQLEQRNITEHVRQIVTAASFLVPLTLLLIFLPPNDDPINVPADLIWQFREISLTGNVLLWGSMTIGYGLLATRWAQNKATNPAKNKQLAGLPDRSSSASKVPL